MASVQLAAYFPSSDINGAAENIDSEIVSFNILGRTMIILDTIEAAEELFERRSGIYSSRCLLCFEWRFVH